MNELLKKDITMKIISVLIAVIIWFLVLDGANPYTSRTLSVQIKVQNEDSLLEKDIINKNKDYPRSIEVKLQGRQDKIDALNESDFEAILDLSKVSDAGTKSLPIDGPTYLGKDNISDITITSSPRYVDLDLDSIEKNTFHLDVKTIGNLKDKFKIINVTATPDILQLQGVDSVLKLVGSVKVYVDVTSIDRDTVVKQSCKVYDKNGKEIPQLEKDLFAEVKISVAKEVGVKLNIKGRPAPNYIDTSRVPSPDMVLITGSPELLSTIEQLSAEPISIEGITQNMISPVHVILPDGVKLVNPAGEIYASVTVEQLSQKKFDITSDDITFNHMEIDNSLKYDIVTSNISVEMKGPKNELDKLDLSGIFPSVDVGGMVEGINKAKLSFIIPGSVKLVKSVEIEISVQKR